MEEISLLLFISGPKSSSKIVLKNIDELCNKNNLKYNLFTVDITENPKIVETANVLATPLLIRVNPPPLRKFVGDLSEKEIDLLI